MKIFISIPQYGRSDKEVNIEKLKLFSIIRNNLTLNCPDLDVELVDTYIQEDSPVGGNKAGVWYLGESIKLLAQSDAVYFADYWETARGCQIERMVCEKYGIKILPHI